MKKTLILIVLLALPLAIAARPSGNFYNAAFQAPDFENGQVATAYVSGQSVFRLSCVCASGDCRGTINLQSNSGAGFQTESVASCSAPQGSSCTTTFSKEFSAPGMAQFRIFCDSTSGSDFTQGSQDYVTVSVLECQDGEVRPCPNQHGVCAGSTQQCVSNEWASCSQSEGYEEQEMTCDGLDNDCNGEVDDADFDTDGYQACTSSPKNEMMLALVDGKMVFYSYDSTSMQYVTEAEYAQPIGIAPGSEAGDLNNDGLNDLAVSRTSANMHSVEAWTYDFDTGNWYPYATVLSASASGPYPAFYIGDILDFDDDGLNELLVSNAITGNVEIWGKKLPGSSFEMLAVLSHSNPGTIYSKAAGDLNGNGIPEILLQPNITSPGPLEVWEYNPSIGSYVRLAFVTLPLDKAKRPKTMIVDDGEANNDVTLDGLADYVFCGNSYEVHVLSYTPATDMYGIVFSSTGGTSFSQTCSSGDLTGDGNADLFVGRTPQGRIYSFNGSAFNVAWQLTQSYVSPVGSSFIGDCDNDGKNELVYGRGGSNQQTVMIENENGIFTTTHVWNMSRADIVIGDLLPLNSQPLDCEDSSASISPGQPEECNDSVDNNCDGLVDEGC